MERKGKFFWICVFILVIFAITIFATEKTDAKVLVFENCDDTSGWGTGGSSAILSLDYVDKIEGSASFNLTSTSYGWGHIKITNYDFWDWSDYNYISFWGKYDGRIESYIAPYLEIITYYNVAILMEYTS